MGERIIILVGQNGGSISSCAAGGGGTFVVKEPYNLASSIIVIAGGGGGNEVGNIPHGGETGQLGGDFTDYGNAEEGPITNGLGYGGVSGHGQPGSGFYGDATGSFGHGGTGAKGFINGGTGGINSVNGGFGGGGAAQNVANGGGGGFSGGASGDSHGSTGIDGQKHGGGGGGSYNANATLLAATGDYNNGHGKVIVKLLGATGGVSSGSSDIKPTLDAESWETKESYDSNSNYSGFNNEVFTTGSGNDAVTGEWVQVDLKNKAQVNKLSLNCHYDIDNINSDDANVVGGLNSPKDFSLFASNDNTNWSLINSWTNKTKADYYNSSNEEFLTHELPITETNRYQFWRLVVNKITGGSFLSLSEMKLHGYYEKFSFTATSEGAKATGSVGSSSEYSSSYSAGQAFNGNTNTGEWLSIGNSYDKNGNYILTESQFDGYKGEWIEISTYPPRKVYFFKIWPRTSINQYGGSSPASFRLYGSLNNSDWYAIKDWNGLTSADYYSSGSYTPFIAQLDEPVSYRYYRLVINKATTYPGLVTSYVSICELEFYGNEYVEYTEPTRLYYGTSNLSEGATVYINEGDGPNPIPENFTVTTIEKISGICDGQTILVSSGSYLLENVTNVFNLTSSYQDVPGSKISYVPPVNTNNILYNFTALMGYQGDGHPISHWKLYVDNVEITNFRRTISAQYMEIPTDIKYNFVVGDVNDVANGKFLTWDTAKEIKLMAREYGSSWEVKLFQTYHFDGAGSTVLVKPSLEIEAIGPYKLEIEVIDEIKHTTNELTTEMNSTKDRLTAIETKIEQDIVNIFSGNENNNSITDNIGFLESINGNGIGGKSEIC